MGGIAENVAGCLAVGESRQMGARAREVGAGRMHDAHATESEDRHSDSGRAVAELTLLLPNRELEAVERAAANRGLTMGQLLRRLIRDFLGGLDEGHLPGEPGVSTD